MYNKKKGFVMVASVVCMLVVLVLCLFLINLVSFSFSLNQQFAKNQELNFEYKQLFLDFKDNHIIDGNYKYNYQILNSDDNPNIKAVVYYTNNNNLLFYAIYNFENAEVLAYQTDNFFITEKKYNDTIYYYLADMVRYKEAVNVNT